jgi:hypothetical protein
LVVEQGGAAAGSDHRIDHQRKVGIFPAKGDYFLDDLRGMEHSCFYPAQRKSGLDPVELETKEGCVDRRNPRHLARNLRDDRGDGTDSVNAVGGEGFQVGLQSGAGVRIRSGDRQHHGWI